MYVSYVLPKYEDLCLFIGQSFNFAAQFVEPHHRAMIAGGNHRSIFSFRIVEGLSDCAHSLGCNWRRFAFKNETYIDVGVAGLFSDEAEMFRINLALIIRKICIDNLGCLQETGELRTCMQVVTSLWCLCNKITFLSGLIRRKSVLSTCKTIVRLWSSISAGVILICLADSCTSLFSEETLETELVRARLARIASKSWGAGLFSLLSTSMSQALMLWRTFLSISGDLTPKFVRTDCDRWRFDKGLDSRLLLVSLAVES